ncbi:MAG: PD-(D/E)XK nuclease domain-containing protein [Lachnospiraceae bacterium]|nr:PD-(D/E)XK nuclease domain-containing protein [Lachnospiraceae bacterium]
MQNVYLGRRNEIEKDIIEFKTAKTEEELPEAPNEAIKQIHEKHYDYGLPKEKATYNIGIGFYKKICKVEVEQVI